MADGIFADHRGDKILLPHMYAIRWRQVELLLRMHPEGWIPTIQIPDGVCPILFGLAPKTETTS